ncbi:MAG TPA: Hsp70 family protein [Candidatus Sulfopaludibacter sp.]|jgi:molecular chaperone DnaK (HSP70)|nr:Hsp70 family protein [Candidatus Sulfopaludibacter sp.]
MKVGIDLGTTNSAMAFIDEREGDDRDFPPVHIFETPQMVAAGRVEARRTLPSFLFLEDGQPVGVYAREQGAIVPTRLVHSAKSWLSNPDVDRTAKILPWDSQETGRVLSPVEVSSRFIAKFRDEWDKAKGVPLAEQDIVLTVPASFDEEARELTVLAARDAGLEKLTLLEEPAAAFYSWIANNLAASRKKLFDGQTVLVCDVGGGTSDFSLIKVSRDGDMVNFTRTAVGKHLLLGGDNLDLTLAWLVETKLNVPLSIRQRSGLRRACSAAKEKLLNDPTLKSVEITVLGTGSSLIGKSLRSEILREEALELALEGFLPFSERGEGPKDEKRSLFRELGLPYVSDPAVTRHLNAFLESANETPDAILFNGGFFIPRILQERVADVVAKWYGRRPEILENSELDLAVARGAAYYSYVRSTGSGVLVRGGLPRTYYIGLGESKDGKFPAVCLVPRGAEEGSNIEVDNAALQLVANRPVSFRLYSSLTRTEDKLGDVLEFAAGDPELHSHAPLNAVIRFGKKAEERLIPVKLGARLTEIGTLESWCESKISDNRWRLEFELRKQAAQAPSERKAAAVISEQALAASLELISQVFSVTAKSPVAPEELPARLEQTMGLGRNSWPLAAIRQMADAFLSNADGRKKGPAYEVRWLNLCGFCMRPGFGFPGDDFRIEQARKVYSGGLTYANQAQNEIDWWIFWGRLAGGLNRNQQTDIYQRLSASLLPRGNKKPQRINASLHREMWRTASSLELLPLGTKTELGEALIKRVKAGDYKESELWCLSRLGARQLFYGPINLVVPPAAVTRWAEALLNATNAGDVLAAMGRRTEDPTRDLPAATRDVIKRKLQSLNHADRLLAVFEGEEEDDRTLGRIFGEDLPSGLVLAEQAG